VDRHDLDLTSLIAGLLFVALGLVFLSDRTGLIDLDVRWIWPSLLMGLGIAGLASGWGRGDEREGRGT
jgi:cell wall-active antibiotic response 4TMS protein YvqF